MSKDDSIDILNFGKRNLCETATISERYSVEDDGIYHIHEEVRIVGSLASKRLVMPKDTFIEAFHKYLGGTL